MKFPLFFTLLALFGLVLSIPLPRKNIVVSYPSSTPDHIVDAAKQAIVDAGGWITHSYKLFKGFSATTPDKGIDSLKTQTVDPQYQPNIEEDREVHIQ